jgi:transcriptional regulator with XRE-family HTH domain
MRNFFSIIFLQGSDTMTIGERIKKLRKALCLNQTEFGKKIGLATNTIANYEIGRRSVSDQTIKSICREFNVNILWLEKGDGDMFLPEPEGLLEELSTQYDLNETEIKILHNYLELSENERANFMETLKKIFKK